MARVREGKIESLLNKHLQEAGENTNLAYENAGEWVKEQLDQKKVKPTDFSFRAIAEASMRVAGYDQGLPAMHDISVSKLSEALSGTAFPILTNTVINSELISQYQTYEENVDMLVTRGRSTNTYKETIGGLQAMSGLLYTPEMHPVEATSFGEKKVEIYLNKFQRKIAVTKELMYNDRTGDILALARQIGKKAGQELQKHVIQTIVVTNRHNLPMESGASDNYCAVFNGTALTQAQFYSNDHSALTNVYGGQTNDNLIAGGLNVSNLDAARLLFSNMKDEKGDEIVVDPQILLVPKSLELTAYQLFNSAQEPGTADNDTNPFGPGKMAAYRVMASQFLDNESTSEWYLGDFSEQVVLLSWEDMNVTEQVNGPESFEKDIVSQYKVSQGYGAGHKDLVYIVKSSG